MNRHIPQRWDVDNSWYFVTVVTRQRKPYFLSEQTCQILVNACRFMRNKVPFRLGALVILPDHWHALFKPGSNITIEAITGGIKQNAFHAARKDGLTVLWQPRFLDHRIRDEADYNYHLEYIRLNPCKHDLVDNEQKTWPWWFVHPNPHGER